MKRLILAPLILILLTSCQSKRDICALWAAGQINNGEVAKKLGINLDNTKYYANRQAKIEGFCKYYRN